MNKFIKRILSITIAVALCFSLSTSVFAASPKDIMVDSLVPATGSEVQPRGQISGYTQGWISRESPVIYIPCESSTIFTSGMGMTIKASQANFSGSVYVYGEATEGTASSMGEHILPMDDEIHPAGLTHRGVKMYKLTFGHIPAGGMFFVQVWIYG